MADSYNSVWDILSPHTSDKWYGEPYDSIGIERLKEGGAAGSVGGDLLLFQGELRRSIWGYGLSELQCFTESGIEGEIHYSFSSNEASGGGY